MHTLTHACANAGMQAHTHTVHITSAPGSPAHLRLLGVMTLNHREISGESSEVVTHISCTYSQPEEVDMKMYDVM